MGFRFSIIIGFFVLLYSALLFKLYNLQIEKGDLYAVKAESQLKLAGLIEPVRGSIYFTDKKGSLIPAAINKDYPFIAAAPKEIEDVKEAVAALAPIVGKSEKALQSILGKSNSSYAPILAKATPEQVALINKSNIPGIYVEDIPARFYPLKESGSQVLGFVSPNNSSDNRPIGEYGVERFYNDQLFGKKGALSGELVTKRTPGEDIKLTIDRNIQSKAEEIITKLIADYQASAGSFIVEEPKSGKILAMGAYPNFDPNIYGSSDIHNFLNPTLQEVYEPGSVFKVLTMAAGIDAGAITPESTYFDSGSLTLNNRTIKNWDGKAHGETTMTGVIEQSLNTGAAFAERKTGHKTFLSYLKSFGFKDLTGIDLPGERAGSLATLETKTMTDINFATASYGQGISVTPLALINAVSALGNGGTLMRPYVNVALEPKEIRRVVKESTAKKVAAMMISAVDKAQIAHIPGYALAGKTGTAFIPNFGHSGYTDQVINTYVGFGPTADPQFAILIRLDKPSGAPLAGLTVVPAFKELAEFIIGYMNIGPDRLDSSDN